MKLIHIRDLSFRNYFFSHIIGMETMNTTVMVVEQLRRCKLHKGSPGFPLLPQQSISCWRYLQMLNATKSQGSLDCLQSVPAVPTCFCDFEITSAHGVLFEACGQGAGGAPTWVTLTGPEGDERVPGVREGKPPGSGRRGVCVEGCVWRGEPRFAPSERTRLRHFAVGPRADR